MKLRDYQKKVIEKTKEFINSNEKELVVELFTGLGKTFLIPHIAKELVGSGYRIYIVSDISQLIKQLKEHFKNTSLEVSILSDNEKTNKNSPIILSTDQTLYNRLKNAKLEPTGKIALIADEYHKRIEGERFKLILNKLQPNKIIGLTATPFDFNGIKMFNNTFCPISQKEAKEKGYLSPIKYYVPRIVTTMDFEKIDKGVADYSAEDIRKLYSDKQFKKWFVKFAKSLVLNKRQTLVFTSNIAMAEEYCSLIKEIEPTAQVVHSKQNKDKNQQIIKDFKNGKIKTLVSVTSLTIGFDAPNVDTVINLRPTKSYPLFFQMVGRGSRIYENKKITEFYDITDCLIRMGIPEDFVPFKSKKEFKKNKLQQTIVEQLINRTNEGITEITREKIENYKIYLKELERKSLATLTIDELRELFNATNDVRLLVLIANEYHRRKYGWMLKTKTVEWIIKNMEDVLEKLSEYNKEASTIKAYKTRIRNILNSGKKLASIGFFPDWFYKETIKKYGLIENW